MVDGTACFKFDDVRNFFIDSGPDKTCNRTAKTNGIEAGMSEKLRQPRNLLDLLFSANRMINPRKMSRNTLGGHSLAFVLHHRVPRRYDKTYFLFPVHSHPLSPKKRQARI